MFPRVSSRSLVEDLKTNVTSGFPEPKPIEPAWSPPDATWEGSREAALPEPITLVTSPQVANAAVNDCDPWRGINDHHGWHTEVWAFAPDERHDLFLPELAWPVWQTGKKFEKLG